MSAIQTLKKKLNEEHTRLSQLVGEPVAVTAAGPASLDVIDEIIKVLEDHETQLEKLWHDMKHKK